MHAERRALWLSVAGALFFSALGFGFSVVTDADTVTVAYQVAWRG